MMEKHIYWINSAIRIQKKSKVTLHDGVRTWLATDHIADSTSTYSAVELWASWVQVPTLRPFLISPPSLSAALPV